jgi:FHS family Na+ dependent glucose MFS transporter 1
MADVTLAASPATQRVKRNQTAAYFVAFISLGLTASSLGPTLPGLAANTRSSISQISILFTVQALGVLVGDLVSGRWYDRAPAHPFLVGVILALAVALALTPLVSSLWVLAAIMFLIGIGVGSIDVGGNTLLVWVHRHDVGPRMNGLHFFFGLGALIAPILVAQAIALSGGITWAYWLLAVLVLPAAFLLMRLPSPDAALEVDESPEERPRWWLILLIATMFFLFVGTEISFGGWIYTYAITLNVVTTTTAGYLTSLFWGALTLGRLLSIPLATRMQPRHMLMVDIAGLLVFLSLPLAVPGSAWVVWVAAFGVGLSMANVFPTLITMGERYLPVTGNITGWFLVGGSLGSMLVPWLIGQRFESTGPQVTLVILLATSTLAAGVLAIFLMVVRAPQSPEVVRSE